MRSDLTMLCTRCRVRLPPLESCPFCMRALEAGRSTLLASTRRPWPVLPWKILGWLVGLLGLIAVVATPLLALLLLGVQLFAHDEPSLSMALGMIPVATMSFAFGMGIVLAVVGGAAALIAVLVGKLLQPARGFDVYPLVSPAPHRRSAGTFAAEPTSTSSTTRT